MKLFAKLLFSLIFFTSLSFAQEIPNPSFENWNNDRDPVDWDGIAILQVDDAYDGSFAVSMQILTDSSGNNIIPELSVGDFGIGTDVSQRYAGFRGYYKFKPNGNEWFNVTIKMIHQGLQIGNGIAQFPATAPSTWTVFELPITYSTDDIPDSANILISLSNSNGTGVVGSNATVDFVSFELPTSLNINSEIPQYFELAQNYPNPFNPSTTINYSLPKSGFVHLSIYDMIGQEVAILVDEEELAGNYKVEFNASSLTSGVYFYKLHSGGYTETKKLILLR